MSEPIKIRTLFVLDDDDKSGLLKAYSRKPENKTAPKEEIFVNIKKEPDTHKPVVIDENKSSDDGKKNEVKNTMPHKKTKWVPAAAAVFAALIIGVAAVIIIGGKSGGNTVQPNNSSVSTASSSVSSKASEAGKTFSVSSTASQTSKTSSVSNKTSQTSKTSVSETTEVTTPVVSEPSVEVTTPVSSEPSVRNEPSVSSVPVQPSVIQPESQGEKVEPSQVSSETEIITGALSPSINYVLDKSKGTLTISGKGVITEAVGENSEKLIIENGITGIGKNTFADFRALTSVTLPETLTDIQYCAFADCISLKTLKLPNGVKTIGDNAFAGCVSLETIFIPESVSDIDEPAFDGCDKLTIQGKKGSYAETFAKKQGIKFTAV